MLESNRLIKAFNELPKPARVSIGIGAILLAGAVIGRLTKKPKRRNKRVQRRKHNKKGKKMAKNNRIFISFAMEDIRIRDLLVGQAKHEKSPFEFVDMSVKQPWDSQWKTNCRTKIKGCDGIIALVSKNSAKADGQLWEVACAKEEKIPILGVYISTADRPTTLPSQFSGVRVVTWTWDNIAKFIKSL